MPENSSIATRTWARAIEALVVSVPLIVFLLFYRWGGELRYVTYTSRWLGALPRPVLFDLTLFAIAIGIWLVARLHKVTRVLFLLVFVPVGMFAVIFRATDHYYYASTRVNLNAYVLYGNVGMIEEGIGVVMHSPLCLVLVLLVTAHYATYAFAPSYRAMLSRVADRASALPAWATLAPAALLLVVLAVNAQAIRKNPRRFSTLKSFSGEYEFFDALPAFLQEEALTKGAAAPRPANLFLPSPTDTLAGASTPRTRPDIFLITVESFNAVYTLPAKELNPALTEDVMPWFRSLDSAGFMLSKVYTSSAYTFNGITGMLCSQYTMSEIVWGKDCLPEVLGRAGYDPYSLVSIKQLRPYRYDNFKAMGFARDHVFDAVGMRRGKQNIYFSFMVDKELFDFAAHVTDSVSKAMPRKPLFMHVATNQMHVPGYFQNTTCEPYPFPPGLTVDALTKNMLNSARCTDRDLHDFVQHLRDAGLYDNAIIIITADHAFNIGFWDHKENELARVPLWIKFPRADSGVRLDRSRLAGQVDVMPTILGFMGLASGRPMYGRSLLDTGAERAAIPGISSSRLLSRATPGGIEFHTHGTADVPASTLAELDALFDTVLYFDQHPAEFTGAAASRDSARRPR
ncbi:MAG: LTA synthase family protein [Gemmatimonadaceae bacterium]